jgi:hypothetical protein
MTSGIKTDNNRGFHNRFVDNVISRSLGRASSFTASSGAAIRPAMTPDMIPDIKPYLDSSESDKRSVNIEDKGSRTTDKNNEHVRSDQESIAPIYFKVQYDEDSGSNNSKNNNNDKSKNIDNNNKKNNNSEFYRNKHNEMDSLLSRETLSQKDNHQTSRFVLPRELPSFISPSFKPKGELNSKSFQSIDTTTKTIPITTTRVQTPNISIHIERIEIIAPSSRTMTGNSSLTLKNTSPDSIHDANSSHLSLKDYLANMSKGRY